MAPPRLLLSRLLRCRRPPPSTLSLSSSHFCFTQAEHFDNTTPCHMFPLSNLHPFAPYNFSSSRAYSTRHSDGGDFNHDSSATRPDLSVPVIDHGGACNSEIAEAIISGGGGEYSLPVHAVVSLLDGYHDLIGLPWWLVIVSSTLVLRAALLPILILQFHKLKRITELFPKLPPPLPPPLSGKSYVGQLSLFRKERRAIGCPSYLWFLAYISLQFPCFLLLMTSIRRMSLDHHPGFDCGGALWFQNLTEYPHGVSAPIFPLVIAGLHFINVQISFRTSSIGKVSGLFGLLAKYYKNYLNFLTLPMFFIGFCIPQGSLVYWLTNSSLTLIQQLSLSHPRVREKLGLPYKKYPAKAADLEKIGTLEEMSLDPSKKQKRKIFIQSLSPRELVSRSVQLLAEGDKDRAIPLLRLALDKDPEYTRALLVMGQTLLQKGFPAEATEYLERAISKLFLNGLPTEAEEVDLLILVSQWAGTAYIRQGKFAEGIAHLERVVRFKEPEDSKSKAHYYDGLLLLSSALYNVDRKAEAAKYLRMAAAYNPDYNVYLEQCENEDNIIGDLESCRRGDH